MNVIARLKLLKRWITKIFLIKEKSGVKVKIPFFTKVKYNLMGFTDFQYEIFDLKHNDPSEYISMWERYRLEGLDGEFASLLGQKLLFARTFGKDINVPHIFAWISKGRLVDPENGGNAVDIIELLNKEKELIVKPNHSVGGGKGIFSLRQDNGKYFMDDEEVNQQEIKKTIAEHDDYLVVQKICSHEYSKTVCPYTANTMRIVTVINEDRSKAEVLFAFHRFGTRDSIPVDNMSKGGLFTYIDEKTGICGKAKQLYHIEKVFEKHPDTGAQIDGLQIPDWNKVIDYVCSSHLKFPFYDFFAWDIMLNENGTPYVLEINRGSDLSIQAICPMRKKKLGQYMQGKGLLDKR